MSEPELFAAIFDRHFEAIRRYLVRRVDASVADDLASSTFVVAFERRTEFRVEASTARPWLYGIATNLLRNALRSQRRSNDLADRLAVESGTLDLEDAGLQAVSDAELLGLVLRELDRDQRDVLLLHAWEELPYPEIAAALGIPIGTVRSRLSRARQRLRARLVESGRLSEGDLR